MPITDSATFMAGGGPMLGPIELTCTISENHTWANQVTMEPVESGANRTDHIIEVPYRLEIVATIADIPASSWLQRAQAGFNFAVSNVPPLNNPESIIGEQSFEKFNAGKARGVDVAGRFSKAYSQLSSLGFSQRSLSAYESSIVALSRLLQLNASRTPFDYISPLGPMTGLVFESITVPVDTTQDLLFNAVMVEYIEEGVSRSVSLASAQEDLSGDAADLGTQSTVELQVPKALQAPPIQVPQALGG